MRLLLCGLAAALAAGCGGDDAYGTTTFPSGDTGPSPTVPGDERQCGSVPQVDIRGMDCQELTDAWLDITGAMKHCGKAADCRVATSPCANGIDVACYYEVNTCPGLDEALFVSESEGCEPPDIREVCKNCSKPEIDCVGGVCLFQFDTYSR